MIDPKPAGDAEPEPDTGGSAKADTAPELRTRRSFVRSRRSSFIDLVEGDDDSDPGCAEDSSPGQTKFQLKPFSWCKVGLMRQTRELEYIPVPSAAAYWNCTARLYWLADIVMTESPLLAIQAQDWIARRTLPGFDQDPQELAGSLHAAMVTAGLGGYKLRQHDVHMLSGACGCTLRGVHVPFLVQEDLIMQRQEYLERRKLIKKDPDVRAVLRSFWSVTKTIKGSQARYVDLHLGIAKALCRSFDLESTRRQLADEWIKMTDNGRKSMAYHLFADPLFCLADVWTFSARPSVYAHFLATVLLAIAIESDSESMALELMPLSEICFMEVFCKQLWSGVEELGDEDSEMDSEDEDDISPSPTISGESLQPVAPHPPARKRHVRSRSKHLIDNTAGPWPNDIARQKSSLLAKIISVDSQTTGSTITPLSQGSTRSNLQLNTSRQHTSRTYCYRPELPACAIVPPLGRVPTPLWKNPTIEGPPMFNGQGRLQFTFGRQCLTDYWCGSQTERLGTRHHLYTGADHLPGVQFRSNIPKVKCAAFPAPNKGKYARAPPPLSRGQTLHDPYPPAGHFRAPMSSRVEDFQRAAFLPTPPH